MSDDVDVEAIAIARRVRTIMGAAPLLEAVEAREAVATLLVIILGAFEHGRARIVELEAEVAELHRMLDEHGL